MRALQAPIAGAGAGTGAGAAVRRGALPTGAAAACSLLIGRMLITYWLHAHHLLVACAGLAVPRGPQRPVCEPAGWSGLCTFRLPR